MRLLARGIVVKAKEVLTVSLNRDGVEGRDGDQSVARSNCSS